jgi:hypothetical protein
VGTVLLAESEFASIRLELDTEANGPRIRIVDVRAGVDRYFDPLVLEGIVWASEDQLAALIDPSSRWSVETDAAPDL